MINVNILQFTKSYCLMLIMMSIVGVGSFSACNKKSKIDSNQPPNATEQFFTLKVTKTGTGSVSASWYSTMSSGKVTDAQIVQIPKGAKVILTAIDQSGNTTTNAIWNNTTKSDTYEFTMDADKSVDVNIVSQYLLTVSKTGKGIVTASWTGGSATDAQLSAGVWIDENTKVTFTATPDPTTPNVVWNGTIVGNTFPITITANQQVSVAFSATSPTLFALNITQPMITDGVIYAYSDANRTMPISDLTKILKDATVYIKVVPATGKKVTQIVGVDAVSGDNQATIKMTANKTISAIFETLTYQLTLTPATNGTIQAYTNTALTQPVADLNKIPYNTKVYLKITPNTDYVLSALSGIDGGSNTDKTKATVTMNADKIITTTFEVDFTKFEFRDNGSFVTLNKYIGSSTDVTIPSMYNGKPVTTIYNSDGQPYSNGNSVFPPSVTNVIIPNSVTTIGPNAFQLCQLTSITIPSSVQGILDQAFLDCSKLMTIRMESSTPPNAFTYIFNGTPIKKIIYVPKGSLGDYSRAYNWNYYSKNMQEY